MGFKNAIIAAAKTAAVFLKKNESRIELGAGIASLVGCVIVSSKATLKINDILDEGKADLEKVNTGLEMVKEGKVSPEEYTEKDAATDRFIAYRKMVIKMIKNYLPAVVFGVVGIGLLLKSHAVMESRVKELASEVAAISSSFMNYRQNVVNELGEDADRRFLIGQKNEETKENNSSFETANNPTSFVYEIDIASGLYDKNVDIYNGNLIAAERDVNDKLNNEGTLTVAEIIKVLGKRRKPTQAEMHWGFKRDSGTRDRKIAFEMPTKEEKEAFRRGELNVLTVRIVPEMDIFNDVLNPEYMKPENYETWRLVEGDPYAVL